MDAPRPNYGISRIDQPEKKNHGFYVRITHSGTTQQKYFPDKANGGKTKALKAARNFRDGVLKKLPKAKQKAASVKRRRVKQSGMSGVTHVTSKIASGAVYEYWQAAWIDGGTRRTAKFSIDRYGDAKALELAKKARRAAERGKPPERRQSGRPAGLKNRANKSKAKSVKSKAAAKKAAKPKKKAAKKKKS
ncbi:hypothetical protein OAF27_02530 [Verrucomicrobiales bacterium]|nr:hypothetical protein [Verrucomicrobiales bacterium]